MADIVDSRAIQVQQLTSPIASENLAKMLDGRHDTVWVTNQPQDGTEFFVADLGAPTEVETVVVAHGAGRLEFPRAIAIDLAEDPAHWSEAWRGETATWAVAAALSDPREIRMRFLVGPSRARYVRIRQLGQSRFMWGVAEFHVYGPRR